jgi:LEA14-like dessication related protein
MKPLSKPAGPVAVLLLLILTAFSGCAGIGRRLEPPRISFAGIRLEAVSGFETVFKLDLRVINTASVALTLEGIDCELDINGKKFATGVSNAAVKIPSFGTDVVSVRVYASVLDMLRGLRGLPGQERIDYRLRGKVRLGGGAIPPVIPFNAAGSLSAEDLR